jgi:hypothetical protein
MPIDSTTLQMALLGYEAERDKIQGKIAELQRLLKIRNHHAATPVADARAKHGRRRMSAAPRRKSAEAQRKRWAGIPEEKERRVIGQPNCRIRPGQAVSLSSQPSPSLKMGANVFEPAPLG